MHVQTARIRSNKQVSALVLRRALDLAAAHIGEEVTEAVVTIPAYFSQEQRAATLEVGVYCIAYHT